MALAVRAANPEDLPTIATLTRSKRRQLADWEPGFWALAEGADERHRAWLERLVSSDHIISRVAVDGDDVVGFAVSLPREEGWIIDDVCLSPERWDEVGQVLLAEIVERPALTCVPHADVSQACAFREAGWTAISQYRLLRLARHAVPSDPEVTPRRPTAFVLPAPSTFRLDPEDPDALVLLDRDGGHIAGSGSTQAPGIYAPGGTTCVVDRIEGARRDRLIAALTAAAADRGDVQVLLVARSDDAQLLSWLDGQGWRHPVDVVASPGWSSPKPGGMR